MKTKTKVISFELWCKFNDLDPADLDSNFENYLDYREGVWKLNSQQ